MKRWKIEYWDGAKKNNPIEKWFNSLTDEQFKEVAAVIKILEKSGNALKLPHSRPLKKGLFELRELKYGYRIYYSFSGGDIIILLAAGNKSEQERDIRIARKRLSQL